MAGAHQIAADILARADEVTQRLLFTARDSHGVQPPDHQQSQQTLGVTPVGLDAVLRRTLDLARRRHDAPHADSLQRTRQRKPARACLISHTRRAGQTDANATPTCPVLPNNLRMPSSPVWRSTVARDDLARVHVPPHPAANCAMPAPP